jgi:hypothetical protein
MPYCVTKVSMSYSKLSFSYQPISPSEITLKCSSPTLQNLSRFLWAVKMLPTTSFSFNNKLR